MGGGWEVYVSFGTNVRPKKQVYDALLEAAQRLETTQFLWDVEETDVEAWKRWVWATVRTVRQWYTKGSAS